MDLPGIRGPERQRLVHQAGLQHPVAVTLQRPAHEATHLRLVVHQQDGLGPVQLDRRPGVLHGRFVARIAQVSQQIGPPGGHAQQLVHVRRPRIVARDGVMQAFAHPQQRREDIGQLGQSGAIQAGQRLVLAGGDQLAFQVLRRLLGLAQVGDVHGDAQHAHRGSGFVPQRFGPGRQLPTLPAVFVVPRLTPQRCDVGGDRRHAVVPVAEEFVDRATGALAGAYPHLQQAPAQRELDAQLAIGGPENAGALAITASSTAGAIPGAGGSALAPPAPCRRRCCLSRSPPPLWSFSPSCGPVGMLAWSHGPANHRWVLSAA